MTTVLTLLAYAPQDRELRGMLVDHKAELTRRHVLDIVQRWQTLGGDDLLPVLRMAVKPPLVSPAALGLLAKVSPDDARPLIIEDLAREKSLYRDPGQGWDAIELLKALPDRELPELEPVLRAKLHAKNPDLFTVMPLIAHYASTNLLADVDEILSDTESPRGTTHAGRPSHNPGLFALQPLLARARSAGHREDWMGPLVSTRRVAGRDEPASRQPLHRPAIGRVAKSHGALHHCHTWQSQRFARTSQFFHSRQNARRNQTGIGGRAHLNW